MKYYIYIMKSMVSGILYTGQTNNLKDRIRRYNTGKIKSTKNRKPYKLCYFEEFDTRREAMNREWELKKKWNKDRKLKLIDNFDSSLIEKFLGL
jgi:putative endonuclease